MDPSSPAAAKTDWPSVAACSKSVPSAPMTELPASLSHSPHDVDITWTALLSTMAVMSSIHPVFVFGAWYTSTVALGASPMTSSMSSAASPLSCAGAGAAVFRNIGDRGVGAIARLVGGDIAGQVGFQLQEGDRYAGALVPGPVQAGEVVCRSELIGCVRAIQASVRDSGRARLGTTGHHLRRLPHRDA